MLLGNVTEAAEAGDEEDNINMTEVIDNIAVIFFGLEYFMRRVDKFY